VIEVAALTVLAALVVDRNTGLQRVTLKKGTRLFHGTSTEERWEIDDIGMVPFWVSEDRAVAEWFTEWHGGDHPRVLVFELTEDLPDLVRLRGLEDMKQWLEFIGVDPECWGPQEAAYATCEHAGGWLLENNYETGHDILLCDTTGLELIAVEIP
jgi:hypothetical protein